MIGPDRSGDGGSCDVQPDGFDLARRTSSQGRRRQEGREAHPTRGLQTTHDGTKKTEKESKLSQADLRDLLDQVEKAEFSRLKKDYKYSISDAHHLILEITADKKTYKVEVYAFDRVKEKEDVDRFLKVFRRAEGPLAERRGNAGHLQTTLNMMVGLTHTMPTSEP